MPADIRKRGLRFVEEHDAELAHRDVEGAVVDPILLDVPDLERDIRETLGRDAVPGQLDQGCRNIDAYRSARVADGGRRGDCRRSAAAADIEDALARLDVERPQQQRR